MTGPESTTPGDLALAIGDRVRSLRHDRAWTQEDVADRIGLRRTSVANIEAGRQSLTVESLRALCRALEVSADWLLGMDGASEPLLTDPIRQVAVADTITVFRRAFDAAVKEASGDR